MGGQSLDDSLGARSVYALTDIGGNGVHCSLPLPFGVIHDRIQAHAQFSGKLAYGNLPFISKHIAQFK